MPIHILPDLSSRNLSESVLIMVYPECHADESRGYRVKVSDLLLKEKISLPVVSHRKPVLSSFISFIALSGLAKSVVSGIK